MSQIKELFKYIERKIRDEEYVPDAVRGKIKEKKLSFATMICTKTVYKEKDRGGFCRITNQNLPIKWNRTYRSYNKISRVAKNNITGRSIEERILGKR